MELLLLLPLLLWLQLAMVLVRMEGVRRMGPTAPSHHSTVHPLTGLAWLVRGSSSSTGSSSGRPAAPLPKPQKKPKGMPRPIVKDGVLVPPPPGPDMAARGWPPFSDLVTGGYFPPGTYDFSCGTVPSVIATVTPSGLIRWKDETFQSISSFALAVVRTIKPTRQACDGWRECRLKGVKIHEWRAAFLEKREPPAVPPDCIVKQ